MSNHELMDHDPKCHAYGYGRGQRMDICICTGIRIGRADEREQRDAYWREVSEMLAEVTDLRAKVIARCDAHDHRSRIPTPSEWEACATCHTFLVLLDEVTK